MHHLRADHERLWHVMRNDRPAALCGRWLDHPHDPEEAAESAARAEAEARAAEADGGHAGRYCVPCMTVLERAMAAERAARLAQAPPAERTTQDEQADHAGRTSPAS